MKNNKNLVFISIIYLSGIFMGAIDTGIVTPARTIIQNDLNVNDQTGVWMITIYTLAYAASIPIMGKLADKFGRKYVYLVSITLFGLGSLLCGLSQDVGSFSMLLIARCIQALGGGGIIPIATAEFGTSFPEEKRGMALGLVGGVYGVANIFGASAGSAILDIFGVNNWQFIFYINIPITIFIVVCGLKVLKNNKVENSSPIDILGIFVLTAMILSLLYSLKNLDFFDFTASLKTTAVYPFLLLFIVLLPVFVFVERKAKDPVMHLEYFTNRNIAITLSLAFITGIVMMGMIFVPQFSENALKMPSGSGGYLVIMLGVFAGVGAPMSGKLCDMIGAKKVLGFGFIMTIIGACYLIFITIPNSNLPNVLICLALIGLGMGFTIGSPLNYMMLEQTSDNESNSALATLSLMRSIGTTIAPAIMIGFIAQAGMNIQPAIMNTLPPEINLPALPYAKEIDNSVAKLKTDPLTEKKMAGLTFPKLTEYEKVKIDFKGNNSSMEIPNDVLELMKTSDVTTITGNTKIMADEMFKIMIPKIIKEIESGIDKGISGVDDGIKGMPNIPIPGLITVKSELITLKERLLKVKAAIPENFDKGKVNYLTEIEKSRNKIEDIFQKTLNEGFKDVYATMVFSSVFAVFLLLLYRERRKRKI
ncbi:MAG: MFS transporter [Anaerovoracaceae bacterium]